MQRARVLYRIKTAELPELQIPLSHQILGAVHGTSEPYDYLHAVNRDGNPMDCGYQNQKECADSFAR